MVDCNTLGEACEHQQEVTLAAAAVILDMKEKGDVRVGKTGLDLTSIIEGPLSVHDEAKTYIFEGFQSDGAAVKAYMSFEIETFVSRRLDQNVIFGEQTADDDGSIGEDEG